MDYVPRLPHWVTRRPRLYPLFESALHGGLVIVQAAEGSGKTLAVADWARGVAPDGVWVTLDPSTHSRPTVWRRILNALDLPEASRVLAEFESDDPGVFREAAGWSLSQHPRVIVIDDADHISDPQLVEDLLYLSGLGGAGFVLIGRSDFAVPHDKRSAIVSIDDLAFTHDDTVALLEASNLARSLADLIDSRVQGWPRGTRAAVRALQETQGIQASNEIIERALHQETTGVLGMISGRGVAAMRTAQLSSVIGPASALDLADLVSDDELDGALATLVTAGAGMWVDGDDGSQFRLAPHVAASLRVSAKSMPELRDPEFLRKIAVHSEKSGRHGDAAVQLRSISDWDGLRELVKRNFREILVYDKKNWLAITETIPVSVLQRDPVLAVLHALLVNAAPRRTTAQLRATVALALAHIGARVQSTPDPVDRVWTTVALLGAQRLGGRYAASWKTAETLDSLLNTLTPEQRDDVAPLLSLAHVHIGATRFYAGATRASRADFEQSLGSSAVSDWGILHARSMIALTYAMNGEFETVPGALQALEDAPKPRSWSGTYSAAGAHLATAMLAIERGNPDAADAAVDLIQRHFETIEHWPLMLWIRGRASLLRDVPDLAEWDLASQIQRRAHRNPTSEWMSSLLLALRVDLFLAAGEDARAVRLLDVARRSDAMPIRIARARVKLFTGEEEAAVELSTRILTQDGLSPRTRLEALVVQAVAHSRMGVDDRADAQAREATRVSRAHHLVSPLRGIPAAEARRLGFELAAGADFAQNHGPDPFGSRKPVPRLTEAERAVLLALQQYSSAAELAASLFLSPNTVKAHLRSIYRKLGARSRAQALAAASTMGLL